MKSKPGRNFKVSLWLTPVEYYQLLKLSSELEAGKISMYKFIRKTLNLDHKRLTDVSQRSLTSLVKHMSPIKRKKAA